MSEYSTSQPGTVPVATPLPDSPPAPKPDVLYIYSHSSMLYWWPVWAVGYLMALLTYFQGQTKVLGDEPVWFHPSNNLGILFLLTLLLVILITNVPMRGFVSGMVMLGIICVALLLAYLGVWDSILTWVAGLNVHLNLGAYFWFSTALLTAWAVSVFVVDRFTYWEVRASQVTQVEVFGAGSRSYDTTGMQVEKHRGDLFRHWLLGLGSGDLVIRTSGGSREVVEVPNVLFVGSKLTVMQRLIAQDPTAVG